jgi:hypothetical protein
LKKCRAGRQDVVHDNRTERFFLFDGVVKRKGLVRWEELSLIAQDPNGGMLIAKEWVCDDR